MIGSGGAWANGVTAETGHAVDGACNNEEQIWAVAWRGQASGGFLGGLMRCGAAVWSDPQLWRDSVAAGHLDSLAVDASGRARVSDLPGWMASWDDDGRVVTVDVDPSIRPLQAAGGDAVMASGPILNNWALIGGYSAYAGSYGDERSYGGVLDARITGPMGVLYSGTSWDGSTWRRMPTFWMLDFDKTATRLQVGDAVSGSLNWLAPHAMTGVRYSRNYGIAPGRVIVDRPAISGVASLPGAVDVFWGQSRQNQYQVDSGPFVITPPPGMSGNGTVEILVTGVDGRVVRSRQQIYISADILKKGELDFSLDAGELKGRVKDRVAGGSGRLGVGGGVTVEGQAAASDRSRLLGGGVVWVPGGRFGQVTAGAAASRSDTLGHGTLVRGGYQWIDTDWGLDVTGMTSTGLFLTPAEAAAAAGDLLNEDAMVRRRVRGSVWRSTRIGSFSLAGERGDRIDGGSYHGWSAGLSQHRLTGTWSVGVSDIDGIRAVNAGFSIPLGRSGTDLFVDAVSGNDGHVIRTSLQNPVDGNGDNWGWHVGGENDSDAGGRAFAGVRRWGPRTDLSLDVDQSGGGTAWQAGASGAYVWAGREWQAARQAPDAVVVVQTGQPNVAITFRNQQAGRTDSNGRLMLFDAVGWQTETVEIDTRDLDLNQTAAAWTSSFRVPSGSAGVLNIPITASTSCRFWPKTAAGLLWPAGQPVRFENAGDEAVPAVGLDGLVYLSHCGTDTRVIIGECAYNPMADGMNPVCTLPPPEATARD